MPNTLLTFTGASTTVYNFQQEVAEAHRLLMKEETLSTDTHRFTLSQSRSYPVVNGASRGTRKTRSKLTIDCDVLNTAGDGDNTEPMIANVDVSLPVGRSAAKLAEFQDALAAYVASAEFTALIEEGQLADA
jgi:hypothetical protein